jgi:hypothetical protein
VEKTVDENVTPLFRYIITSSLSEFQEFLIDDGRSHAGIYFSNSNLTFFFSISFRCWPSGDCRGILWRLVFIFFRLCIWIWIYTALTVEKESKIKQTQPPSSFLLALFDK